MAEGTAEAEASTVATPNTTPTPLRPKKKRGRPTLAPSPMPAPPTPALTEGSPALSSASVESSEDKQRALLSQFKALLNQQFPKLCQHEWLYQDIRDVLNHYKVGTAITFANAPLGKVRFPKWADKVTGGFQPSLAEMLAYFSTHEVLGHSSHDKFRCVIAEQHIAAKIDALLADPALDRESTKDLRWCELRFNIINGDANVRLSAQHISLHPLSTQDDGDISSQSKTQQLIHPEVMKREAIEGVGFCDGQPPAKRPRTTEEAADIISLLQDEARNVLMDCTEHIEAKLNEANSKIDGEVVKTVSEALETLARDLPRKLDSSLGIFSNKLKNDVDIKIQESVRASVDEALSNRENVLDEQIAGRLTKLEESIREEIRNLPMQDTQSTTYPVWCMPGMPGMPFQMSQMGSMGQMGQQMLQGPALGGYIQQQPTPRNMKPSRDAQQQGGFPNRRTS